MTSIQKLEISGIRSYNPKKPQCIQFDNSMTLIIGQNGTGKTTIIECLKYVTTNTLPPNAKGGAFVYDNNLANDTDVRAEIKLVLKDLYNREIVIQKVLQSSLKKNKIEQKTLEFNILMNDTNTLLNESESNKLLNKTDLSEILNINNSLLDNVMFCHQDESMWCLAEPSIIKKKFDDIFSSTKYTKILENLKNSKKEILCKIKLNQTEISFLLKQKEKKKQLDLKYKETQKDINTKTLKMNDLQVNISECNDILKELNSEYSKVNIIENKLKELKLLKVLDKVKYTENECEEFIQKNEIVKIKEKINNLEKKIKNENDEILKMNELKEKHEIIKTKCAKVLNDKNFTLQQINIISKEVEELKIWIESQNKNFMSKLQIDDITCKNKKYSEIFDIYFEKYEHELCKKSKVVELLSKKYESLKKEIDKNFVKINDSEKFLEDCGENIDLETLNDKIIEIEKNCSENIDLETLNDKILEIEIEYERNVKMNKEIVINEQKKLVKNRLLQELKTKTKKEEITNLNLNSQNFLKLKENLKFLNEKKSFFDIYIEMISSKMSEIDLDSLKTESSIEHGINISKDTCQEILKLGIKTHMCYVCKQPISNLKSFSNNMQLLKNGNSVTKYDAYKKNIKFIDELKNLYDKLIISFKEVSYKFKENQFDFQIIDLKYNEPVKFLEKVMNEIYKMKNSIESCIENIDMAILDLEEECLSINDILNKFKELENIDIKEYDNVDLDILRSKLEKYKKLYQKKLIQKNQNLIFNLKSKNEILENKLQKLEIEIDKKTIKNNNLRDVILKKKTEVSLKINEYEKRDEKLEQQNKNLQEIENLLSKYKESNFVFDLKKYKDLVDENTKNKNQLENLRNHFLIIKEKSKEIEEHLEHFKNISKHKSMLQEIKNFENSLIEKVKINRKSNIIYEYLKILKNKIDKISSTHTKLLENRNMLIGEIKQLNKVLVSLSDELNNEYKNTIKEYNMKYINLKILEISSKDIDKCIKVLDKSIVDYHHTKIEEINLFLKEFWANCYKGNDIDAFKLKVTDSGTKSYSYRLVVIKNEVEMDMRNRCSAGQKMIGSILLRIALNHVFCSNFNILTLDEPTTNLDKENIESLAHTLINVVRRNSRLQLVIITHDEDFLNIMGRTGLEGYYRISRNDYGDSIIERTVF